MGGTDRFPSTLHIDAAMVYEGQDIQIQVGRQLKPLHLTTRLSICMPEYCKLHSGLTVLEDSISGQQTTVSRPIFYHSNMYR